MVCDILIDWFLLSFFFKVDIDIKNLIIDRKSQRDKI